MDVLEKDVLFFKTPGNDTEPAIIALQGLYRTGDAAMKSTIASVTLGINILGTYPELGHQLTPHLYELAYEQVSLIYCFYGEDEIYILHAFQKQASTALEEELAIAEDRYTTLQVCNAAPPLTS